MYAQYQKRACPVNLPIPHLKHNGHNTLLETCHTRKDQFWAKLLRALGHQSMPALTQVAAELLREARSILEDLFRCCSHRASPQKALTALWP